MMVGSNIKIIEPDYYQISDKKDYYKRKFITHQPNVNNHNNTMTKSEFDLISTFRKQ
jgi:hypothetical protein